MPRGDQAGQELSPLKGLIMGDQKSGKSDYIFRAAEAGFYVLYLDGDVGAQCMQAMIRNGRLSPEAARRIFILNVSDYIDSQGRYVWFFAEFFVKFTTQGRFMWNDTLGRPFKLADYKPEEGHEVWEIRPGNMTPDVILGVDSWTTLSTSVLQWKSSDLGVDIIDIEKVSRDLYSGVGHKLTQFLTLLRAIKCPVAVTAHPREYVKLEKPKGRIGSIQEKDMMIEWTKMVPVSGSNPHGLTLGKNFSEIGNIDIDVMGRRTIDYTVTDKRTSGGHLNRKGPVDDLTLAKAIEHSGGEIPDGNQSYDHWLTIWENGTYESPTAKALAPAQGLGKPSESGAALNPPTAVAAKGLGGLGGLKPKPVEK